MLTGSRDLNRAWLILVILHVSLLIHLLLYYLDPARGNSTAFRLLAGIVAAFALGTIAAGWWLNEARVRRIALWLARWRFMYIGLGLAVMFVFGFAMRPEWVYAHMAVALAATFALVYWTFYGGQAVSVRSSWLVTGVIALVMGVTAIRLYGLSYYPSLHADEPWTLSWPVYMIETGQIGDPIMHGFNGQRYDTPRFYLPLAWWLQITGIGLWEARTFTLLLTLLVAGLAGRAAANLYNPLTGIFTAGALFASLILASGARIRHDIGVAVAIAASLWLFSEGIRRERSLLHLLAGVALGLGLFSHYNAALSGVALFAGLYAPRYVQRARAGQLWPERGFWLYGIGGLLAALSVLVIQVLPNPEAFLGNREQQISHAWRTLPGLIDATSFYIQSIFMFSHLEFVLIAVGVVAALWRRQVFDWTLVIALGLGHLLLGAFAGVAPDHDYYIVPLAPLYGMLIGSLFGCGFQPAQAGTEINLRHVRVVAFALFLVANLGLSLETPLRALLNRQPLRLPPTPAAQWVRDHIEPGATILGPHRHYLWLTDYEYASGYIPYRTLPSIRESFPTNDDIWDSIGIDVIIDDPTLVENDVVADVIDSGYAESRGYTLAAEIPAGDETIRVYTLSGD